ncbi:hypothetical protein BKK44_08435 [Bacillus cereus]|nr:hypothetical protein BKK44_08435 [Bacillus cereus]
MRKKILLFLLTGLLLSGCGEDPESKISNFASTIEKDTSSVNLHTLSQEDTKKQFNITNEEVSSYVVRSTYTDAELVEYGVFYLTDKANSKQVKNKIREHIKSVAKRMKNVDETYYEIAKNGVIEEKDQYIFFCIAENQENMKNSFISYFSEEQPTNNEQNIINQN